MFSKAILFDFDGVLADTFDFCFKINHDMGPPITVDEYRQKFEGNINEAFKSTPRLKRKKEEADFFALYTPELMKKHLYAGMAELLESLSKDFFLFIVSSTTSQPIKMFLERERVSSCFTEIYGNDIDKSKVVKISMILDKYHLEPKNCVFITDTLGDIMEAKKCDVKSIAVTWGYQLPETLQKGEPHDIVGNVAQLQSAVVHYFTQHP